HRRGDASSRLGWPIAECGKHDTLLQANLGPAPCAGRTRLSPACEDSSMQIFLETERLALRRFTEDDVDNLVELDSDPDVMRFINGGRPTPRQEIESDVPPTFLDYYKRFAGYGFWAAIEKSAGQIG